MKPSQSWCVMFPGNFEVVLSASTLCVARATDEDRELIPSSEPWALSDVGKRRRQWFTAKYLGICHSYPTDKIVTSGWCAVKVEPPSKVQVTNTKDSYSITWDHVNQLDCLTYVVRVREANQWSKVMCADTPPPHKKTQNKPMHMHVADLPLPLLSRDRSHFIPYPRTVSS